MCIYLAGPDTLDSARFRSGSNDALKQKVVCTQPMHNSDFDLEVCLLVSINAGHQIGVVVNMIVFEVPGSDAPVDRARADKWYRLVVVVPTSASIQLQTNSSMPSPTQSTSSREARRHPHRYKPRQIDEVENILLQLRKRSNGHSLGRVHHHATPASLTLFIQCPPRTGH